MFLAVAEVVLREHGLLFERLLNDSKNMTIHDQLQYNFKEYILYFYRNPDIHKFSNQSLFHLPDELRGKIRPDYLRCEKSYRRKLETIFTAGMQQGIIRPGDPMIKVWSFKTKRDGVLGWLRGSPDLNEGNILDFWNDFWCGVQENKGGK